MLFRIDRNPPRRSLRLFAVLWFPLFVLLVAFWLRRFVPGATEWTPWLIGPTLAIALVGAVIPGAIRWLYVGLMVVTFPIGFVVSSLVMALLFYGLMTPIGLALRLAGRDPLRKRPDSDLTTYWQPRPLVRDPERYFKQY